MPPGDSPVDALEAEREVDDIAEVDPAVAPQPTNVVQPVAAGDIDPLMAEATAPITAGESPVRERRRWWHRVFEWEAPPHETGANGNGHAAGVTVEREAVAVEPSGRPPEADGESPHVVVDAPEPPVEPATPEAALPSAEGHLAPPPQPSTSDADADDVWVEPDETEVAGAAATDATLSPPLLEQSPQHDDAPAALPPPLDDARAHERYLTRGPWVPLPLTDHPDGADPDAFDAPPLERARTGEIPRVPMLDAERARLIPEPEREPTWLRRRRTRRPRVRRVTRVVRRVDAWSVFKVALLFWSVAYVILLVAGVLLWSVAVSTGTVDNVESFVKDLLALDTFTFDGDKIFRASWVLGAFMAIAGTGITVTVAVLYNLFSDLVGGVRITVLEEEVVQRPPSEPPG